MERTNMIILAATSYVKPALACNMLIQQGFDRRRLLSGWVAIGVCCTFSGSVLSNDGSIEVSRTRMIGDHRIVSFSKTSFDILGE